MPSKKSYKLALITGATSGLGLELTHFLKEKGMEIIETGRTSKTLPIDLTNPSERKRLLEIISERKPDLIINNAGFGFYGDTMELSIEEQEQMIEVNIKALMEISIHGARELIKVGKKGIILNIGSAAAFFSFPKFNVYSASKRFVVQFSKALDAEIRSKGVRVLCACPGQIATSFRSRAAKGHQQQRDRRTMSVETATWHIWKQIEEEKGVYIFDWKTQAMVAVSKVIPRPLLERILINSIENRL